MAKKKSKSSAMQYSLQMSSSAHRTYEKTYTKLVSVKKIALVKSANYWETVTTFYQSSSLTW